jgi:hypothetical protein
LQLLTEKVRKKVVKNVRGSAFAEASRGSAFGVDLDMVFQQDDAEHGVVHFDGRISRRDPDRCYRTIGAAAEEQDDH